MYLDFSKNITKQLNSIFKNYRFNSSFEESFKTNLIYFFVLKLNRQELSIPEFCFHISLNSPSNIQDFKSISFDLLEQFHLDIINSFNPNSFTEIEFERNFSNSDIAFFNLCKLIEKTDSYKKNGLPFPAYYIASDETPPTYLRDFLFGFEQSKYTYINKSNSKKNFFNDKYYSERFFVPHMSNQDILQQRILDTKLFMLNNSLFKNFNKNLHLFKIENIFTLDNFFDFDIDIIRVEDTFVIDIGNRYKEEDYTIVLTPDHSNIYNDILSTMNLIKGFQRKLDLLETFLQEN